MFSRGNFTIQQLPYFNTFCPSLYSGFQMPVRPSLFSYLPSFPTPQFRTFDYFAPTNIFAQYAQLKNPFEYSFNQYSLYIPPVQYFSAMPRFEFSTPSITTPVSSQNTQGVVSTGTRSSIQGNGKLDPAFVNRVKQTAQRINCDWEDLMAVIFSESGFNPKAGVKNGKVGSAVGLIQFMDKGGIACLKQHYGISVTREQLVQMSAIQQMDYVEKVFLASKKSAGYKDSDKLDGPTLYALIFLPGRANRDVLCVKGERDKNGKLLKYYESNPIDYDNDGDIDKKDLATRINKKHEEMRRHYFA